MWTQKRIRSLTNRGLVMLELNQVEAAYGKALILNKMSFTVKAGQVVALLGRNGAGKSTTMKTIIGLTTAERGCT